MAENDNDPPFDLARAKVDLKYFTEWAFPEGVVDEAAPLTMETIARMLEMIKAGENRLFITPRTISYPLVPFFDRDDDERPFKFYPIYGIPILRNDSIFLAGACVDGGAELSACHAIGKSAIAREFLVWRFRRRRLPRKLKKALAKSLLVGRRLGPRERVRVRRWFGR